MATDDTVTEAPKPLGIDLQEETNRTFSLDPNSKRISRIALSQISGDANQPRKLFDQAKLQELADSIKDVGLIMPISVYVDPDDRDRYKVAVGERRYRASKLAGLEKIDCIVVENNIEEIQLIENVQREDLSPLEEASAYKRYMEKHRISQGDLAKVVGKQRNTVNEILRITSLPESILMRLDDYPHVTKSQLILIAKEADTIKQEKLWFNAKQGTLTVQDARAVSKGEKKQSDLSPTEQAIKALQGVAKKFEKLETLDAEEAKAVKAAVKVINKNLKDKTSA
ncbi:ParB/RepB/Spo0J family partition protein [Granulosicoccus sp. 3-233]|uniref:ParB/RepB/Spo0J family partition protein n=1 Tax=Granulosicoccus sp. 3-233 TaxID=3417969 RepID=UPI003D358A39